MPLHLFYRETMEKHSISLLNDYYGVLLTNKQREMLELFYNDDMSLGELAEQFSVSRQAVRDAIQRGEKSLFEYEEKLGLAKKSLLLLKTSDELCEKLDSNEIKSARMCAEKIKAILED